MQQHGIAFGQAVAPGADEAAAMLLPQEALELREVFSRLLPSVELI